MSSLGDASIEILLLILNNVDQQSALYECALVNKTFYAMAIPLLWREPGGAKRGHNFLPRLLQSLRQADKHCLHSTPLGDNIRTLNVSESTRLQDLHAVINNAPLVEELAIDIKELNDTDMEQIALNCPQLKCLSFTNYFEVSDRFFDPLPHCANLRELNILAIVHPDQPLASLQHCPLEKLRLRSFGFDGDFTKKTFFGGIPTLTHLDMDYKTGGFLRYCQTLPSRTLFPVLTDLRIVKNHFGVYNDLVPFFKAHPLIRTLSLEGMNIDPAVMTSLATDLVHLQRLTLIKNGELPPFTQAFHRVEKLTLRGCHMNVDSTVRMATHFPNIHYLHIGKEIKNWRRIPSDPVIGEEFDNWQQVLSDFSDSESDLWEDNTESSISQSDGPTIESLTKLTYLDFASYDSVPNNLKANLPRRMRGRLLREDLDHIRETALGLVWIDHGC
ncbi:hypothetical protein [Absidia glauca]|uniref:Uncharacterized protein n=1 Tax=Absidia glauca TaxID=4829 RepID=A0A168P6Y9_ABSGL|nr:hypothetical protein [Absidia glauca]